MSRLKREEARIVHAHSLCVEMRERSLLTGLHDHKGHP